MIAFGRTVALLAAASLAAGAAAQEKPPADPAATRAAIAEATRAGEVWIEGRRAYRHIPAISAALVNGGATVWARGFGTTDRAGKVAATPDTIYSVCSISKLFTAIALMQQWEAGKVRLDDPVTAYLPWATLAPDARDSVPVTMRSLLTHSSGLPRESDFPYWAGPDFKFPSQAAVHERIATQAPLYPSSTIYQYSNLGLTLVGDAVEAVAGKPFAAHVTETVIAPLGLKDTRAGVPAELWGKRLAVGWGSLEPDGSRPPLKLFDPAGITPAAGFTSSAADLAKFAAWNLRVLKTGNAEVLKASTLREMQRVQFETPDGKTRRGLGYGMAKVGDMQVLGHSGSCPGYRSIVWFAPKSDLGVSVAMNAMDAPDEIARALLQLVGSRMKAAAFDPPKDEPGFALADYTGRYDGQPWGADEAIVPWAGGLISIPLDGSQLEESAVRLKPLGKDRFLVITGEGEERDVVVFARDAQGRIVRSVQHSNPSVRTGPL